MRVRLATSGPFHLEATVRVLQRRATNRVDVWDPDGRYLRALATDEGIAVLTVTNRGTLDEPDVRLEVHGRPASTGGRAAMEETVRRVLGLDVNPEPLQRLATGRGRLAETARALRGMRPPRFAGLFETFANVIPFQQVSLDAGMAIVGRLVERFGQAVEHEDRRLFVFPDARVVAEAQTGALKSCGLSLRKAEALHRIACDIVSGRLSAERLSRASNAEALRYLTALQGIGPWSASLVLLRGLGRVDVFPPGDVGAAHGLARLVQPATGPSLDRVVRQLGDHRGYLYFCVLGASLLSRQLIHAAPRAPAQK